jgi:hypothetical protein
VVAQTIGLFLRSSPSPAGKHDAAEAQYNRPAAPLENWALQYPSTYESADTGKRFTAETIKNRYRSFCWRIFRHIKSTFGPGAFTAPGPSVASCALLPALPEISRAKPNYRLGTNQIALFGRRGRRGKRYQT